MASQQRYSLRRGARPLGVGCLVLLFCARVGSAMFMRAPEVPVERLLKNTAAYVKENPNDPQGYYLLGRINALAFVLKSDKLRVFQRQGKQLPYLDPWQGRPTPGTPLKAERLKKHVVDSITNFRKAIALKPDGGLYHLGLAYILEQGSELSHEVGPPGPDAAAGGGQAQPGKEQIAAWKALIAKLGAADSKTREQAQGDLAAQMPAAAATLLEHVNDPDAERQTRVRSVLAGYWKEQAIAGYLRAHELAFRTDRKIQHRPLRGLMSLVSYEAGKSYIRLVQQRGARKPETKTIASVQKHLAELEGKPRGPITPIIFSLAPAGGLPDLLADGAVVRFDLDGDGAPQAWPWVKPTTGLLVWDPGGRGRITSGRQLFGSVTFWMFFHDGFHALDVLDDNRDGKLAGAELVGLAGWFDRNTNGRSEPGEVIALERLGIRAIRTKPAGMAGGAPFHRAGLEMADGTTRALYDWTPHPRSAR